MRGRRFSMRGRRLAVRGRRSAMPHEVVCQSRGGFPSAEPVLEIFHPRYQGFRGYPSAEPRFWRCSNRGTLVLEVFHPRTRGFGGFPPAELRFWRFSIILADFTMNIIIFGTFKYLQFSRFHQNGGNFRRGELWHGEFWRGGIWRGEREARSFWTRSFWRGYFLDAEFLERRVSGAVSSWKRTSGTSEFRKLGYGDSSYGDPLYWDSPMWGFPKS